MILCDLPYGTTRNKWDSVIPLDKLWKQYERIIKDRYCEMKEKGKISDTILKINGLDRVDSSKGYTIDNVVPCCAICNTAKNKMTQKEFKEWIKTVYENYVK